MATENSTAHEGAEKTLAQLWSETRRLLQGAIAARDFASARELLGNLEAVHEMMQEEG
jgi:hypothetical protein